MNDSDLVRGLRERSPVAVRHLSECWVPSVWRFVYVRVHGDQHLAEDIVSECMLALIAAVSDPENVISNLGGWLRSVAANKVNDHFRAAARVQHLLDQAQADNRKTTDGDPSEQQESKERRATIREVLDSLGDSQRMALEWKYIDKLSVREIAARLDLTEKAAESILFRARREFRERLERNSDTVPAAKPPGQPESGGDSAHVIRTATQRSPSSPPKSASPEEADEGDPERETRLQRGSFGTGRPTMHGEAARADSEAEPNGVEHPADAEHSIPGSHGE